MQWANIRKTVSGQGIKPYPMCCHLKRAGGKKAKKQSTNAKKKKKKKKRETPMANQAYHSRPM
jgi:hypothetical protein